MARRRARKGIETPGNPCENVLMNIVLTCICGNSFAAEDACAERLIACPVCEELLSVSTGERVERGHALSAEDTNVLPDGEIRLKLEPGDERVEADDECVVPEMEDGRDTYDFSREHNTLLSSAIASHRFYGAIGVIPLPLPASCLVYSATNEWALAGCGMNVQILNMRAGEKTRLFHKHETPVTAVALAPDGRSALTGDANGDLLWWDLANGAITHRQRAHVGAVHALAVAGDGMHAVSGGADGATRLWDLSCGCHTVPIASPGVQEEVTAVAFSTDGQFFLAGDAAGHIDVWTTQTGNFLQRLRAPADPIADVRCHDGLITAVAGPEASEVAVHPTVCRWEVRTGRPRPCFDDAVAPAMIAGCVSLDREGRRLLVAGRSPDLPFQQLPVLADVMMEMRDGIRDFFRVRSDTRYCPSSLHVLSLNTGARLHAFPAIGSTIHRLAASPDNTRLLAASTDGNLHVFAMPEA